MNTADQRALIAQLQTPGAALAAEAQAARDEVRRLANALSEREAELAAVTAERDRLRRRTHEIAEAKDAEHAERARELGRLQASMRDAEVWANEWMQSWRHENGELSEHPKDGLFRDHYPWWKHASEHNRMAVLGLLERVATVTAERDRLGILANDAGAELAAVTAERDAWRPTDNELERVFDPREKCRCGSGAHPRPCPRHKDAFRNHVDSLNLGMLTGFDGLDDMKACDAAERSIHELGAARINAERDLEALRERMEALAARWEECPRGRGWDSDFARQLREALAALTAAPAVEAPSAVERARADAFRECARDAEEAALEYQSSAEASNGDEPCVSEGAGALWDASRRYEALAALTAAPAVEPAPHTDSNAGREQTSDSSAAEPGSSCASAGEDRLSKPASSSTSEPAPALAAEAPEPPPGWQWATWQGKPELDPDGTQRVRLSGTMNTRSLVDAWADYSAEPCPYESVMPREQPPAPAAPAAPARDESVPPPDGWNVITHDAVAGEIRSGGPWGTYRVFPWMGRWSWHYTEAHDGYASRSTAVTAAEQHRDGYAPAAPASEPALQEIADSIRHRASMEPHEFREGARWAAHIVATWPSACDHHLATKAGAR